MKKSTKIAIIAGIVIAVIISALAIVVHLRQSAIEGTEHANETTSQKINEAVNAITNPKAKQNGTVNSEGGESQVYAIVQSYRVNSGFNDPRLPAQHLTNSSLSNNVILIQIITVMDKHYEETSSIPEPSPVEFKFPKTELVQMIHKIPFLNQDSQVKTWTKNNYPNYDGYETLIEYNGKYYLMWIFVPK